MNFKISAARKCFSPNQLKTTEKMIHNQTRLKDYVPKQIKSVVKYFIHCANFNPFMISSYSQEGEDLVLGRLFNKDNGFYVDVGAHHPKRFSNTFLFYKKGWKGINIDAMPGSMKLFRNQRPRDINLEIPVAKEQKTLTYYKFNEPALNSFSEEIALSRRKPYKIVSTQTMETCPLSIILEKYICTTQEIDFFSIDVEGLDLEVLQSNDWEKFRPKVILVEQLRSSIHQLHDDPIHQFLGVRSYHLYAKLVNTAFYIDNEYASKLLA